MKDRSLLLLLKSLQLINSINPHVETSTVRHWLCEDVHAPTLNAQISQVHNIPDASGRTTE